MVWLAAGGSTAVLGYLLYRYLSIPPRPLDVVIPGEKNGEEENTSRVRAPTFNLEEPKSEQAAPAPSQSQDQRLFKQGNGTIHSKISGEGEQSPIVVSQPPAMAPPSLPPRVKPPRSGNTLAPPRPGGSALRSPPSAAASLRVPATKVLPNTSMAPTSSIMPQNGKPSRKVILQPGHSPLDWALLTKSPNAKLRGRDIPDQLIRVTPSQLKYYNGRKGRDAWSVYQGKVYNITPYMPFHPGGEGELMRGAAKDAGQLFMEVHPWVNWDNMLAECMIGILVGEDEVKDNSGSGLDEMD